MENKFILTSPEFAKLVDISAESLRSRRRRGLYNGMYISQNNSYRWKRPRPMHVRGPLVRDAIRLSAHASNTKNKVASRQTLQPRRRNKNSRNHYNELSSAAHGALTKYPNVKFEIHNEIKMLAKAQRKISAAAAEEIIPEVIEIAQERHRQKILEKMKEPFIPEVHKDYAEVLKSHYRVLRKDARMDYEEDTSKWKNPLNPEDNKPNVIKKKFYYW